MYCPWMCRRHVWRVRWSFRDQLACGAEENVKKKKKKWRNFLLFDEKSGYPLEIFKCACGFTFSLCRRALEEIITQFHTRISNISCVHNVIIFPYLKTISLWILLEILDFFCFFNQILTQKLTQEIRRR